MTDLLTLTVLFACALSCSLAVLFGEYLYRCLAKQSHGDGADGLDAVFGDWPRLPDDFEPFHSTCVTEGGQPNNGAR